VSLLDNYHDLPFGGGMKRPLGRAKGASSIERKCMESPPTFIWGKMLEKPKIKWSMYFENEGSGAVYAQEKY